ncbi:MAG: phosphomannomutase [Deltaproteobacteria bacterium]|nr:phosphomannomutase [Deltaproteobacteria bacterium]
MTEKTDRLETLMGKSSVQFGTSGARGLVKDMTDEVCYVYTAAFIQYLEDVGELSGKGTIAIGGDLRPSTDRIMRAVAKAVADRMYTPENCGTLPTPALAYHGLIHKIPTVMVTGSHIPVERNGIKYTKKEGEILKHDEIGMKRQSVTFPRRLFDDQGMLTDEVELPPPRNDAVDAYINRYVHFFGNDCLSGKKIGVYQHSAVGRELMVTILSRLGADVTPLGFSDTFIPVDTEAIRPEDVESGTMWAGKHEFDAVVSTDGDSDRPLISDECGRWLRGDLAGILCADYFDADAVVTTVSCNTAVEKSGLFETVIRTKIGSPFVIEGMQRARAMGARCVVGYEANGGFLIGSDIDRNGKILKALPTRDAVVVHIAILLLATERKRTISELASGLPQRYTVSNRLKDFPTERSKAKIAELSTGDEKKDAKAIEDVFGPQFGKVAGVNATDGLRITFDNDENIHLRPSGNAPEFRCYTEADTESRAGEINNICMDIMDTWRKP